MDGFWWPIKPKIPQFEADFGVARKHALESYAKAHEAACVAAHKATPATGYLKLARFCQAAVPLL
jgi:hypothetical protein